MKPMLLTESAELPVGEEWIFEVKYDGFRCTLEWAIGEPAPVLKSRNDHNLNDMFPEILSFCEQMYELMKPFLPLVLDGELVYLVNNYQSKFSVVQKRGRMRNAETIAAHAKQFPCHYVIFDLLLLKGEEQQNRYLSSRKQSLMKWMSAVKLPASVQYEKHQRLQAIDVIDNGQALTYLVTSHNGEGIIAKKKSSKWISDMRSKSWLKIKLWKYVTVVLTKYDQANGYFVGGIFHEEQFIDIVTFRHGMSDEKLRTVVTFFQSKGKQNKDFWEIEPSICVDIACIDFDGSKLREPRFSAFRFDVDPMQCTWKQMHRQLQPIPETVQITHPEKQVFPAIHLSKDDYLLYLQNVAPMMLPFLNNRLLTVIRYPHGVPGDSFYQKNSPEGTPDFVTTFQANKIQYIMCNNIETLLWLGNQLALEFHIPFQNVQTEKPMEIVFDLDPPSVHEFGLAIEAALKMKVIFDQFNMQSFVKTSGGKGMQIYIPIPFNTFSYEETGVFTKFVCEFLVEQYPNWFTIERLKKNRGNKLYLDYVQHREGKTIIAPYSARGNEGGLVATPLMWEEVNQTLKPEMFTIRTVMNRINEIGNPFRDFKVVGEKQDFAKVLQQLNGLT
ncbi:DNA ligase D [Solibacillus sp. CAU 1738]|uniref:DNA ligase D n=1 Tax=Solibacillus sp. CAU 1738 TaxID=3140363 RepID=UPI003260058E